jgi:hypothetical protein
MAWKQESIAAASFESAWFPMASYSASSYAEVVHGLGRLPEHVQVRGCAIVPRMHRCVCSSCVRMQANRRAVCVNSACAPVSSSALTTSCLPPTVYPGLDAQVVYKTSDAPNSEYYFEGSGMAQNSVSLTVHRRAIR